MAEYQNTETPATGVQQTPPMKPDNHMVMAILTTIFCCLPFGIVAIVQASKVNKLYYSNQYDLAQVTADSAKKWSLISLGIGVAIWVIYVILAIAGVASLSVLSELG